MNKRFVLTACLSSLAALVVVPALADRPPHSDEATPYLIAQQTQPITFRNMALTSRNQMMFLTGQVVNRSSQPMWVNGATFRFTRRVDGRTVTYATVNVPVVQRVGANSTGAVDALVDVRNYQTTTIYVESVDAWASR